MRQDRAILLYTLVKGYTLNGGKIIEESILDYVEGKYSGNISHPSLITLLCIKGGVKFTKAPLTLTGIPKAPVEGEEEDRRQSIKRKRVETVEQPRDPAPTIKLTEERSSEERGAFEAYSE